MRNLLRRTTITTIKQSSALVVQKVLSLNTVQSSAGICIYLSTPMEVHTTALIKTLLPHKIKIYVPRVVTNTPPTMQMIQLKTEKDLDGLITNQWGISEPVFSSKSIVAAPLDIDTIIVPGVAFDEKCGRCGHGLGFYDRYIAETAKTRVAAGKQPPILIGLSLPQQLIASVPMEKHDFHMTYVVTPTTIYRKTAAYDSNEDTNSDNDDDDEDEDEDDNSNRNPSPPDDIILSGASGTMRLPPHVFQQRIRRSASAAANHNRSRSTLSSNSQISAPNTPQKRRRSTGLHNLWAELASGHQHSGAHSEREGISSVSLSSSTDTSSRSRLTWKERLNLVKAIDFRGGWRIVPPPPDKRQRDQMFNERFGWMSQSTSVKKQEWHTTLRRQRVGSTEATTSSGSRRPQLSEKQTTWVSWGSGASGVLGQGHFEDVHVPEFTTLTEYPADVAVGGNHIVAVESTGISLYTWGKNECGQLGNGTTSPAPTCVPVCIGELKPKSSSATGSSVTGTAVPVANDSSSASTTAPTTAPSTSSPASFAAPPPNATKDAAYSSIASVSNIQSKLLKWRRSSIANFVSNRPSSLAQSHVQRISCGWDHTIVLTFGGETYGWGSNSRGQIGIGAEAVGQNIRYPTCITIDEMQGEAKKIGIIGVATGRAHSILLRSDGTMYGFGDNKYHQLGLETDETTTTALSSSASASGSSGSSGTSGSPELLPSPGRVQWTSSQIVIEVCCGWQFSSAVSHSGEVFTWGDNRKNQCAHDATAFPTLPRPTRVPFGSQRSTSISRIACGWSHMLALDKNGVVYSWGRFDMGQLGIGLVKGTGTNKVQSKPEYSDTFVFEVTISNDEIFNGKRKNKIVQIACGSEHSLAVTAGGNLYSWGWGEHGNLGHGTTKSEYVPLRVSHFGEANGCYVRDVRTGGAAVFARVARTTHL